MEDVFNPNMDELNLPPEVELPSEEVFNPEEFGKEKYEIDKVEQLIDPNTGDSIDKSKLTTLEYVMAIARKMGHDVQNPDPSCKNCLGRGYTGYVEPKKEEIVEPKNRAERRRLEKEAKKNNSLTNSCPVPCRCIYKDKKLADEADKNMPRNVNRTQKRNMLKSSKGVKGKKLAAKYRELLKNKGQEELKEKEVIENVG